MTFYLQQFRFVSLYKMPEYSVKILNLKNILSESIIIPVFLWFAFPYAVHFFDGTKETGI